MLSRVDGTYFVARCHYVKGIDRQTDQTNRFTARSPTPHTPHKIAIARFFQGIYSSILDPTQSTCSAVLARLGEAERDALLSTDWPAVQPGRAGLARKRVRPLGPGRSDWPEISLDGYVDVSVRYGAAQHPNREKLRCFCSESTFP